METSPAHRTRLFCARHTRQANSVTGPVSLSWTVTDATSSDSATTTITRYDPPTAVSRTVTISLDAVDAEILLVVWQRLLHLLLWRCRPLSL